MAPYDSDYYYINYRNRLHQILYKPTPKVTNIASHSYNYMFIYIYMFYLYFYCVLYNIGKINTSIHPYIHTTAHFLTSNKHFQINIID